MNRLFGSKPWKSITSLGFEGFSFNLLERLSTDNQSKEITVLGNFPLFN